MRIIVLVVALMGCILIPFGSSLLFQDDDDDYFAVATSIAYGKFPYFSNEYHVGEKMPFASVGPGVLASPFVFLFSLIDRLEQAPIAQKREWDNRAWTWTLFGFHFSVYFYLLLGILILYETLKQWGSEFGAVLTTLMITIGGGGLLIYAFARPVMAHVFEFLVVTLGISLISLILKGRRLKYHGELIGLCAAFIFLTRYNNAFLSIGLIVAFLHIQWRTDRTIGMRQVARVAIPFVIPIGIFRGLPVLANGFSQYDQSYAGVLSRLVPEIDPLFYMARIREIFFGVDMGLVYTAPVLLISLIALWLYRNSISKVWLFLSAFALFNFYFAVMWRSFGSCYGYRNIAFTATPLFSIYLVTLMDHLLARFGKLLLVLACITVAYLPLMSMVVFERSRKYHVVYMTTPYGTDTFSQPTYHKDLLLDLKQHPFQPIVRAFETSWQPLLVSRRRPPLVRMLQRLLLYFVPPILFLLFYSPLQRRIQRAIA